MSRKIIQIAATPESEYYYRFVTVLCEDGTLWQLPLRSSDDSREMKSSDWQRLPPIPDF